MKTYHKNPRQITDTQLDSLTEWLDELGDLSGIVHDLNSDQTITGNQRCKAIDVNACEIVLTQELDEPDRQGTVALGYVAWNEARYNYRAVRWTKEQNAKANVVANKSGGTWDFEILGAEFELDDLKEWGFSDLELEMEGLTVESEEPAENSVDDTIDKAEELQEKWQVELGQIWTIGEHAIICGDCREIDTWHNLLTAAGVDKVNGVFTSPPYAMQRKSQYGGVLVDEYVNWWEAAQENVKGNLADDGSFFVNIKPHCEGGKRVLYVFDLVLAMARRWGWLVVDTLCWKRITSPGRWTNRFKNLFEPVYHFSLDAACRFRPRNVLQEFKSDPSGYFSYDQATAIKDRPSGFDTIGSMRSPHFDGALPGNLIEASGAGGDGHWGAFPVALPNFFIRAYSDPGDIWLDPFCGSGTTIVAAHNNDRRGLGIELLPKYCAVILERLAKVTEVEPQLINPHFPTEEQGG